MKFDKIVILLGCLLFTTAACGGSSTPAGSGGSGGQGGQDSSSGGAGGMAAGSGGAGGSGADACAQACSKVAALVMEYGCNANASCDCSPECADELEAWTACIPHPQNTTECSCNAANELACGSTVCKAEKDAFQACYYK